MKTSHFTVAIVIGTRPEAIKLAPVIKSLSQSPQLDTCTILTWQHKEMVEQVMKLFNLRADHNLNIMQEKQTLTDITCNILQGLEAVFKEVQPDLTLIQGDTTTALAATLAAFYQQIPVGHVEAGLRTDNFYSPYPEEVNRRLISQLAQLHFAPTALAVENLQKAQVLGKIYQTGNTVIDALLDIASREPDYGALPDLDWEYRRILLVTVHRRENWGRPLENIAQGLRWILEQFPDVSILLPVHLNPKVREPIQKFLGDHPQVFLTDPLNYQELVAVMQRSFLILTDSGGLQEEAPSLGKPVLVLRYTTERIEAITAGTAKLVGTNSEEILATTSYLLQNHEAYTKMATKINPFGNGQAAKLIREVIEDYLQQSA